MAYRDDANVTKPTFPGFILIPKMKLLITFILLIPSNTLSSTELFAKRLQDQDPTGARKDFVPENVIDSYNARVSSPGHFYTADDIYNAILHTILCGISTDSVSYGPNNVCLEVNGDKYKRAGVILRQIKELTYPSNHVAIPPVEQVLEKTKTTKTFSYSVPTRTSAIYDWIAKMRKENASTGINEKIHFSEIVRTWNTMLAPNGEFPDCKNKALALALAIINETSTNALIPADGTEHFEIQEQFCIIYRSYNQKASWVEECNATKLPTKNELVAAEARLKELLREKSTMKRNQKSHP